MTDQLPVNLLAEETMVDPSSTLPSFFEMKLVDATHESGIKSLISVLDAIVAQLRIRMSTSRHGTIRKKIYAGLYNILTYYKDELQVLITLTIENRMLHSKACATLSESIYGLKRSRIRNGSISEINKGDRTRVALLLALGPYLKKRMNEWYEKEKQKRCETVENLSNNMDHQLDGERFLGWIRKLRASVFVLYPLFRLSYNSVDVAYKFAYLIGKTVHYNPSLHALGQVVRRITSSELSHPHATLRNDQNNPKEKDLSPSMITLKRWTAFSLASALAVGWLGKLLKEIRKYRREELAQILDRDQHSISSHNRHPSRNGFSIPPPLPPPPLNQKGISIPVDKMRCPICHEHRINPVAASSGYVFCYKCIVLYMKEHGNRCPITGMACTTSQLVRLYESTK